MTFSQVIKQWFQNHQRDLPWRNTKDPFKIWISEIILQQTRVNQGLPYYYKFIEKYPDIQALATSSIENILKSWQGLGYYSRARNLHKAAKTIFYEHNGKFPVNYQQIRELSGIGDYTAAAIASFAFDLPHPVIDGNVNRLISRYFGYAEPIDSGKGKKFIKNAVEEVFDFSEPANFNQAIMEFGALQCIPSGPDCLVCPLNAGCKAYADETVAMIPTKKNKLKVSKRYLHYLIIRSKDRVLIQQRSEGDIWANLFEFPLIETEGPVSAEELINTPRWRSIAGSETVNVKYVSGDIIHKLSHRELVTRFYEIEVDESKGEPEKTLNIPVSQIHKYPVPRLIEKYLQDRMEEYQLSNV